MTELQKVFCDNLKRLREERNLSQRELAMRCGMDQGRLSKIENGKVEPGLVTIQKIASGLEIIPSLMLMGGEYEQSISNSLATVALFSDKEQTMIRDLISYIGEKCDLHKSLSIRVANRLSELNHIREN